MKATFTKSTGHLTVETSVGTFSNELPESEHDLYDTWLGNDDYDVNVFEYDDPKNPGRFIATLYEVDKSPGGGIIGEGLETCQVEIL